ncbi:magnesium/cobalt transporter CorA [methane-oxidizing endosymbiont of Gigantopelta aegis]|uniref:magnesium/cobalt transporter CorA n=1 Tax=methane-oxidizing endosymbiont of Gigantopelta aegis TaxID=2794938 RepID=UPI0018DC1CE7|nr:magnesium/cobalt transporter CorA [methane-oxidizing endosymbiont of Gigantopelta aegis]
MLRLFKIHHNLIHKLDCESPVTPADLQQADWIDAQEPDECERDLLEHLIRDELPESDDMEEIETSARYFIDESGLHLHSLFLSQTEGRHETETVAFILQKKRLITIREADIADFRLFRMRARHKMISCQSVSELMITLLEHKIENLADIVEELHSKLGDLSQDVLENENTDLQAAISQLAKLENSNGKIRLCLMDSMRELSFLQRHLIKQPELLEICRKIMRDIDSLQSHTAFLFEKINFLMDSIQGFINIRQNQIIKIFSIAAVIFLPPTVVASIYGMNFEFMPELDWKYGYPTAIFIMILSAIAPYLFFKHKGWLQ